VHWAGSKAVMPGWVVTLSRACNAPGIVWSAQWALSWAAARSSPATRRRSREKLDAVVVAISAPRARRQAVNAATR